jgi:hypothetical protein
MDRSAIGKNRQAIDESALPKFFAPRRRHPGEAPFLSCALVRGELGRRFGDNGWNVHDTAPI